ncbi:MAG: aldehyde dehydrogenase family protein, partial [Gemmatimonadetes bacterium]|nr:aldehyde dehydrogenase family protein [Gemmatimonadota bacterium]
SIWKETGDSLLEMLASIRVGDPRDFRNFVNAVIDRSAFQKISGYIEEAKKSPDLEILAGGGSDDRKGYFIEPTVVLSKDPKSALMCEEIFGPVLTIHVYPDS